MYVEDKLQQRVSGDEYYFVLSAILFLPVVVARSLFLPPNAQLQRRYFDRMDQTASRVVTWLTIRYRRSRLLTSKPNFMT